MPTNSKKHKYYIILECEPYDDPSRIIGIFNQRKKAVKLCEDTYSKEDFSWMEIWEIGMNKIFGHDDCRWSYDCNGWKEEGRNYDETIR